MKLFEKYKSLENREKNNILLIISYSLILISVYLPFYEKLSVNKIDDSSILIKSKNIYNTIFYGFESGILLHIIIMTIIINGIGYSKTKFSTKFFLIISILFYLLTLQIYFDLSNKSFGEPNILRIGFTLSIFSSFLIIIQSIFLQFIKKNRVADLD